MIERKVLSIVIIPYRIIEKNEDITLMISSENEYRRVDSAPLIDFREGDYLFRSKMNGEGFTQINYVKMNNKEKEKYFSVKKEPKDRFSRFAGTSLFPNK